ncbi:MAG: TIGR03790 family protein, partial [Gammaproteobacteria bacterium]
MYKAIKISIFSLIAGVFSLPEVAAAAAADPIQLILPKHKLQADELGVIINNRDPLSIKVGRYYQKQRNIPEKNIVTIEINPANTLLTPQEFSRVFTTVNQKLGANVQAIALTWAAPYKVNCMSITSAFAFGYNPAFCSSKLCANTQPSRYYASESLSPYSDYKMRPVMSLAATDFSLAKQLIDRGKASDASNPPGTAYLVSTEDRARNVRSVFYNRIENQLSDTTKINVIHTHAIKNKTDVLFYFTGLKNVPYIDTLTFTPGAVADHLTSTGGRLTTSGQMSALRWLEAGATGSYGTVIEPCNLLSKFPNPLLLMDNYLYGMTLIEAYWKSVQQPGEGIFIGDPLAAPFDGYRLKKTQSALILETRTLTPGVYSVSQALEPIGPFHSWPQVITVKPHQT